MYLLFIIIELVFFDKLECINSHSGYTSYYIGCINYHSGYITSRTQESIINSVKPKYHLVMYYPKYYYEFNYIEYFYYSAKKWAEKNYHYTFENLQYYVPQALASISQKTILTYYYQY